MSSGYTEEWLRDYQAKRGLKMSVVSDGPPKVSKYNNQKTPAFGIMFASKREADRYEQLRLMEAGGVVKNIKLQMRYPLEVNGTKICDYIADFVYLERPQRGPTNSWAEVVEDAKGVKTPVYKLKRRLMEAIYGIIIRET